VKIVLLWMVLLLSWNALASSTHPEDFAYVLPLELDGDGAIYRLVLPEAVYRNTYRADLGDMRVFNGHAQVVPYLLKRPTVVAQQAFSESLPLFPLGADKTDDAGTEMAIHIRTDEQGAVVDMRHQPQHTIPTSLPGSYLIDASALQGPFDQLELRWPSSEENFILAVRLEVSNDLRQWRVVPGQHQLANLQQEGQQILHNTLTLPAIEARYLRIDWPLARYGLQLEQASLGLHLPGEALPMQWLSLDAIVGEQAGDYLFDSGGHFPVERLQLHLPEENTLVSVEWASRADLVQPWRVRHRGLVYRLGELQSPALELPLNSDRYWRLRVDQESGGLGIGSPRLLIGWQPHQLHFVARGEAPFMLAYGAYAVAPQQVAGVPLMQQLLNSQQDTLIKAAHHGASHTLGGPSRLTPPPEPLPWRQWLLWGVLVLGVLLLAAMAWQLSRQMRQAS
jgi:hypothetical protein